MHNSIHYQMDFVIFFVDKHDSVTLNIELGSNLISPESKNLQCLQLRCALLNINSKVKRKPRHLCPHYPGFDTWKGGRPMLLLTLQFKWWHVADFEDYFVLKCFALFRFFLLLKVTQKNCNKIEI